MELFTADILDTQFIVIEYSSMVRKEIGYPI